MEGSKLNAAYENALNGKWQGEPAGEKVSKEVINLNQIENDEHTHKPPVCNIPTNYLKSTAFLDSAASLYIIGLKALCKICRSARMKQNVRHSKWEFNGNNSNR